MNYFKVNNVEWEFVKNPYKVKKIEYLFRNLKDKKYLEWYVVAESYYGIGDVLISDTPNGTPKYQLLHDDIKDIIPVRQTKTMNKLRDLKESYENEKFFNFRDDDYRADNTRVEDYGYFSFLHNSDVNPSWKKYKKYKVLFTTYRYDKKDDIKVIAEKESPLDIVLIIIDRDEKSIKSIQNLTNDKNAKLFIEENRKIIKKVKVNGRRYYYLPQDVPLVSNKGPALGILSAAKEISNELYKEMSSGKVVAVDSEGTPLIATNSRYFVFDHDPISFKKVELTSLKEDLKVDTYETLFETAIQESIFKTKKRDTLEDNLRIFKTNVEKFVNKTASNYPIGTGLNSLFNAYVLTDNYGLDDLTKNMSKEIEKEKEDIKKFIKSCYIGKVVYAVANKDIKVYDFIHSGGFNIRFYENMDDIKNIDDKVTCKVLVYTLKDTIIKDDDIDSLGVYALLEDRNDTALCKKINKLVRDFVNKLEYGEYDLFEAAISDMNKNKDKIFENPIIKAFIKKHDELLKKTDVSYKLDEFLDRRCHGCEIYYKTKGMSLEERPDFFKEKCGSCIMKNKLISLYNDYNISNSNYNNFLKNSSEKIFDELKKYNLRLYNRRTKEIKTFNEVFGSKLDPIMTRNITGLITNYGGLWRIF